MNYFLQTYGCQMNISDSEKINMILFQSGLKKVDDYNDAQIVILNTCSVRKKWEDKVYSLVRDIKRYFKKNNITWYVWITGCMVRKTWLKQDYYNKTRDRITAKKIEVISEENSIFNSDDKLFWKNENIDFVFRIEDTSYLTKILSIILWQDIWNDEKYNEYLKIKQLQDNIWSANVVIQTWCDNFCSYCIVPFTRGREKSRDKSEIINEIKEVVAKWTKEVYLIWQNVNSYWKETRVKLWDIEKMKWKNDTWNNFGFTENNKNLFKNNKNLIWIDILTCSRWQEEYLIWKNLTTKDSQLKSIIKTPFRELLEEVDKIDWLDRIRFTSSNPHDMTFDILDAHFELSKTCSHLHFALQSWDNEILSKMNRRHTYEDFRTQVQYLRSKDPLFAISTDIIVWFPWETEEQFNNTLQAFEELEFDFAYIARYSPRRWTFSADKLEDNISSDIKAKRWHILNNSLEKNVEKRWRLMLWTNQPVLIQWITKMWKFFWRTRNFKEVVFSKKSFYKIWDLVNVRINNLNWWILEGEIVDSI